MSQGWFVMKKILSMNLRVSIIFESLSRLSILVFLALQPWAFSIPPPFFCRLPMSIRPNRLILHKIFFVARSQPVSRRPHRASTVSGREGSLCRTCCRVFFFLNPRRRILDLFCDSFVLRVDDLGGLQRVPNLETNRFFGLDLHLLPFFFEIPGLLIFPSKQALSLVWNDVHFSPFVELPAGFYANKNIADNGRTSLFVVQHRQLADVDFFQ